MHEDHPNEKEVNRTTAGWCQTRQYEGFRRILEQFHFFNSNAIFLARGAAAPSPRRAESLDPCQRGTLAPCNRQSWRLREPETPARLRQDPATDLPRIFVPFCYLALHHGSYIITPLRLLYEQTLVLRHEYDLTRLERKRRVLHHALGIYDTSCSQISFLFAPSLECDIPSHSYYGYS